MEILRDAGLTPIIILVPRSRPCPSRRFSLPNDRPGTSFSRMGIRRCRALVGRHFIRFDRNLDLGTGSVAVEQVQLYLDMPSGEASVLRFIAEAEKWKTQMGEAYDSLVVTESTACKVLKTQQLKNSAVCPSAGPRSTHAYSTFGFTRNRESGVSSDVASTGVCGCPQALRPPVQPSARMFRAAFKSDLGYLPPVPGATYPAGLTPPRTSRCPSTRVRWHRASRKRSGFTSTLDSSTADL